MGDDTRAEYLKSIDTLLQREDDFLLYTSDDSLEDDAAEEDDDVAEETRMSRKLLAGVSVLVGMALGIGLLVGSVVVKLYLDNRAQPPVPVAAPVAEAKPGWVTARQILFEPRITEGDCSVMCGKTIDDLMITLGNGCGTRQIALCHERSVLRDE